MAAGKYNLVIDKKASFVKKFNLYTRYVEEDSIDNVPIDLTGCTIASKIKRRLSDASHIIAFAASISSPEDGEFTLELSAAQTAALAFDLGVYDVLITYPSGFVDKVLEGNVVVEKTAS